MKKVGVIVPSYNHAIYLDLRIQSILNQTYSNFELFILDDMSTDDSKDVLLKYGGAERVKQFVFNQENSGSVFRQWKKGISLVAHCDYIWIAESDDFADTDFLFKMVQILEKDESLAMAYSNSYVVNDRSEKLNFTLSDHRNKTSGLELWSSDFSMKGIDFIKNVLSKNCWINNASAVVFRTNYIMNLGIDIERYRYAGDWAVYLDILLKGNIYYLNECLSYYRDHDNNASKKSNVNNVIVIEIYHIISRIFNSNLYTKSELKSYLDSIRMHIVPYLLRDFRRMNFDSKFIQELKSIDKILYKEMLFLIPKTFSTLAKNKISRFLSL